MYNQIIMDLEKRLKEENSIVTMGDTHETTLLKLHDREDTSLENILIATYNTVKINTHKIKNLETNLDLLASRVYDGETDFTEEEKAEIEESLSVIGDIEELSKHNFFKDCLEDNLYCIEEDINIMFSKQKELMNKIKYPTKKMNDTFNNLVSAAIEVEREIRSNYVVK